ncbi:RT0821/Lpp0805 family surface protein [Ferruginivarius sediminum]|uniref:17 kDa surface antigen n=1 Tax=Ferruginivarius sediminum TaxID=2661937 RepID=A0A369TKP0_9PROT|nr:RT0821/Lpp0805 family surface protein [Ferruginivarius sediminum]RDD63486.1 glycine zipper 2TM domain-containing protein [Ferruginivarius sediminum]
MRSGALSVALALALAVAGCAQNGGPGTKETIGGLSGAAIGGFLGSKVGDGRGQLAATAAGAVIGGLAGLSIGRSLDRADRAKAAETTHDALEHNKTGEVSRWENPDSGHSGSVQPTETYQRNDGTYCREFQQTVTIGGKTEQAYGTACRQPDGSWKIVNS